MPRCSIVVPVYNRAPLTRQCLDALHKTSGSDYEIIVVDDASRDDTQAALDSYRDRIRVIRHEQNTGFATACNDGAAAAMGEFLIFLNNDTIPTKGWLDALVAYADKHPRAAVIGAKLLFPNETIQHAGMVIRPDLHTWHIYVGFPADHPAVNKSRRFQVVTGACMLARRKLFEEAGGFDTAFFNSHEDTDFCLRVGKAGHEIHYCHTSVLYHVESATRQTKSPAEVRNVELYLDRWKGQIQPDEFRYYIEDELIKPVHHVQYPIELAISPLLATTIAWDKSELVDHILQHRSEQVYTLLRDNINLELRLKDLEARLAGQSTEAQVTKLETRVADREAQIAAMTTRQRELQGLLWQAHSQLLEKDQHIRNGLQTPAAQRIRTLVGILDQLNDAVMTLYQSNRWRWANPLNTLTGLFRGPTSTLSGYWRIDDALQAYKEWQLKQNGDMLPQLTESPGLDPASHPSSTRNGRPEIPEDRQAAAWTRPPAQKTEQT